MAEATYNQGYRVSAGKTGTDYTTIYNASTGNMYQNPSGLLCKHQAAFPSGSYLRFNIYRTFLYWATGALPDGAIITNVDLQIYIRLKWTQGRTFKIVVQNGQPDFPHAPAVAGDYYRIYYSGNGGEIASGDIVTDAWNTIALNEDGLEWINKEGWTKLVLRVDKEIAGDAPTTPSEGGDNTEGIQIYGDPVDGIYAKLVITYIVAEVTTEAASSVGIDHAKGNGTATGENITERGFEVKLAFSGTLREAINRSIAGFEGDFEYNLGTGKWEGTLVKTVTETGSFEEGAFVGDLGRFPIAVASDKLFAAETYDYRAYAEIDGELYYGEWVEFTTNSYPSGEGPDDVISPGVPIIEPIPPDELIIPPDEPIIPPWEWPEPDIPPLEPDPDITFGKTFGAFLRGMDTKKDWETLREKCIIYQENMNEFSLTVNHNSLVLKNLVIDIITYIDGDVYPSDLELVESSQQLTPLYLEGISPDGFKDIINDFRFKDVCNVHTLNLNFQKVLNSLNSLYESDYTKEPISYNTMEYIDIQPTAKRMIRQLEDMRKKYGEVTRLTTRNMKRIFTYV